MDTSTRLRRLIPSHSALPQGRMQSPECEACPLFFGTYPKAGTRCQSLQTAQKEANKKSPSLPTPQHLRGTEDALQSTHLCMVSVTSATRSSWVGEKRSPELQVSETLSKVKWTGMEEDIHPITGLWTSHLHLHTHIWVCIHIYTRQTNIHLIIHGKHLIFFFTFYYLCGGHGLYRGLSVPTTWVRGTERGLSGLATSAFTH